MAVLVNDGKESQSPFAPFYFNVSFLFADLVYVEMNFFLAHLSTDSTLQTQTTWIWVALHRTFPLKWLLHMLERNILGKPGQS